MAGDLTLMISQQTPLAMLAAGKSKDNGAISIKQSKDGGLNAKIKFDGYAIVLIVIFVV